jgi:hypothetical protein
MGRAELAVKLNKTNYIPTRGAHVYPRTLIASIVLLLSIFSLTMPTTTAYGESGDVNPLFAAFLERADVTAGTACATDNSVLRRSGEFL